MKEPITELATVEATGLKTYDWNDTKNQALLANTVAKNATREEFVLFLEICKNTGLNPFLREVWCIVTNPTKPEFRACQMMTGINGFYRIANSHPQYDGIEIEYSPNRVEVKLPDNKKNVQSIKVHEWIDAKAYRKDRTRPQIARLYWDEYGFDLVTYSKALSQKAKQPTVMQSKCVEAMALRKAFPQSLNGLMTWEEMGADYAEPNIDSDSLKEMGAAEIERKRAEEIQHKEKIEATKHVDEDAMLEAQGMEEQAEEDAKYDDYQAELDITDPRILVGSKKGHRLSTIMNAKHLENHLKKNMEAIDAHPDGAHFKACAITRIHELVAAFAASQSAESAGVS